MKAITMLSEHSNSEQPFRTTETTEIFFDHLSAQQREMIHAALALLLGPETSEHTRVRATRRLARLGARILPLLLVTLSNYPEITTPSWPWWPPQYEHCAQLLIALSHATQSNIEDLLHHPALEQCAGPVLWVSIIESARLLIHEDHEALLCHGLDTPWSTVRYAAAMALATRTRQTALSQTTIEALHRHLGESDDYPVRLTTSYVLLSCGESIGLEVIIELMSPVVPLEVRRAATFVLATETPLTISVSQRELLTSRLFDALQDADTELSNHAAHALSKIALPAILPCLRDMLANIHHHKQVIILTTLEEMAKQQTMRRRMVHYGLLTRIVSLLQSPVAEVRRQACYTLATCGGEYITAVLGTIMASKDHPAYLEAVEGVRLFRGILRPRTHNQIIRWLLNILQQPEEEAQVTALDSLAYLLLQARTQDNKRGWHDMSQVICNNDIFIRLFDGQSAWVRQRAVELLGLTSERILVCEDMRALMLRRLRLDDDSGVRACAAFICGEVSAQWAIPELILTLLDQDEHVAITAFHALRRLLGNDNVILLYIGKELIYYRDTEDPRPHSLSWEAWTFLDRRQKVAQRTGRRQLHPSP
jgi:HEAT repeat protein